MLRKSYTKHSSFNYHNSDKLNTCNGLLHSTQISPGHSTNIATDSHWERWRTYEEVWYIMFKHTKIKLYPHFQALLYLSQFQTLPKKALVVWVTFLVTWGRTYCIKNITIAYSIQDFSFLIDYCILWFMKTQQGAKSLLEQPITSCKASFLYYCFVQNMILMSCIITDSKRLRPV